HHRADLWQPAQDRGVQPPFGGGPPSGPRVDYLPVKVDDYDILGLHHVVAHGGWRDGESIVTDSQAHIPRRQADQVAFAQLLGRTPHLLADLGEWHGVTTPY